VYTGPPLLQAVRSGAPAGAAAEGGSGSYSEGPGAVLGNLYGALVAANPYQQQQELQQQGRGVSRLATSSSSSSVAGHGMSGSNRGAGVAGGGRSRSSGNTAAVHKGVRQLLRDGGYMKHLLEGLAGVDPEAACVKGALRELLH
jgi:hypothetical protein